MRLAEEIPNRINHERYFDNCFNSPATQVMLAKKGKQRAGTLQMNRAKKLNFDLRNPQRGTFIVKTTTIDNQQLYATQCSKISEGVVQVLKNCLHKKRWWPKNAFAFYRSSLIWDWSYASTIKRGPQCKYPACDARPVKMCKKWNVYLCVTQKTCFQDFHYD